MTNYKFNLKADGNLDTVTLSHIGVVRSYPNVKMIPDDISLLIDINEKGYKLQKILPDIKAGTADKEYADKCNIEFNDAVKALKKHLFGEYYTRLDRFSYTMTICRSYVKIKVYNDATVGTADVFYKMIEDAPVYKEYMKGE